MPGARPPEGTTTGAHPQDGTPTAPADALAGSLPHYGRVLAVCAHPDDETFGLGAVIGTLVAAGTQVELLCLTLGEASTLGAADDLGPRRSRELGCAARLLGIARVVLGDHPDGGLDGVPLDRLADEVAHAGRRADALLVFDDGGITGHPDHQRATDAAVAAAARLEVPVLAWALPGPVATDLADEFDAPFVGRDDEELDFRVRVDRSGQLSAMRCHGSQLADNPVPRRRIELQGDVEHLRLLTAR